MRITFVCPYAGLAGGIRVIAIYAERLCQRGHEVFVISRPRKKPRIKQQIRSLLKGQGLIRLPQEGSHFDNVDVTHKILDIPRDITVSDIPDADVIVASWWTTAEEIADFPPEKGEKAYFIQLHETFQGQPVERVKNTYALPFHKITISQSLVDLMKTEYGDDDVSLIYNSVDTEQFYAPQRTKQSQPTVGLLYTPTFHKGCDISFKAIEIAREKVPNLKLIAFGKSQPSAELPLPPGTEYFQQPDQGQIKNIYAQCDVWLCGSRREGFHLPPLEAMACRTPVVSTAVGGPLDIIKDGSNGYLVPIEDVESLADRLIRVLTMNQEEWKAISDGAYATATNYTWNDATELFEEALLTAVRKGKAKGRVTV